MRERESHENDTEVLHHARYPRANVAPAMTVRSRALLIGWIQIESKQSLGNGRALKDPAHWLDTVLKNNCNVCL